MDILLSMASENDFRDLEFCKKLISRAVTEKNFEVIKCLLSKISAVFVFSTEEFRREVVEHAYSELKLWPFKEIYEIGKESVLGNVLVLSYTLKKISVITPEKLTIFLDLLNLTHIEDPITFEYIPTEGALILDLNETVKSLTKTTVIEKAAEACELFFANGRLEK